ncbi:hypothetical protein D1164_19345 [Mariniphaga sediminis]|uniref:Uncharacterized protein n=1 Tax=Mariniphaga sediminis TaxID=1628158 RepID=A0A399CYF0_9BACT|nr:hypothetical protein D1164_19345 [Mariniphaga sediminis]
MNSIKLLKVKYLPNKLETGILYVSKKYGIAGHLCPCGCGNKIITPLDSTEWQLTIKKDKPSLYPSIGNWQLPCKSHYWIRNGEIKWSYQWSEEEIAAGNSAEEIRRKLYFEKLESKSSK